MSEELAHAEQVMLAHEKPVHFIDKHHKHHKDKPDDVTQKYSSLYSSFDTLKPHEELPPGCNKVQAVTSQYPYLRCLTVCH